VPEFEVQQVPELEVQQVLELEVQQVPEFEVQQVPEFEVQQVPELEVRELEVQQVRELEVQQVLAFVSELPPADWLGQEQERSPSSRKAEAEAAPPVGCFGAKNHEPAARELLSVRRAD
jgi:hypothetical protein